MDEKLTTALGSWAQYRHDIVLYAQQSMVLITGNHFANISSVKDKQVNLTVFIGFFPK
ncbi:MAG: DUF3160 domain-containing protein [Candidatus Heimdallarchaeota archaeon]|nr:DUF3160 domain-containing protein [Candidatus Heimdallarchaeota archaeon]